MRIALVTPYSPEATMGRYAQSILPALSRCHDVHVWCPQAVQLLNASVPVVCFEADSACGDPRLDSYDLLVYQMGSDARYFLPILELAQQRPGLHILHDYVLHHMLEYYYRSVLQQPLTYLRLMERTYGGQARKEAEEIVLGPDGLIWASAMLSNYPLFEPLLSNALGVVVHSEHHLAAVRRAYGGPAVRLNLPVAPLPAPARRSRAQLGIPEDRILMLSTGYVAKTKMHDAVLLALHRSPDLASRVFFAIVGADHSEEGQRLRSMARDLGIGESVRFVGYESDVMMHAWIEHADFCVNLRHPNTEGASLSVLEQMQHGKPIVILPSGAYAEFPAETVVRTSLEELDSLHILLLRLATDQEWRARVGAQARQYVSSGFEPDQYGRNLGGFISEVHRQAPRTRLQQRVSEELQRMGEAAEDLLGCYASEEIERLFAAKSTIHPPIGKMTD